MMPFRHHRFGALTIKARLFAAAMAASVAIPAHAEQRLVHREMVETLEAYAVYKMGRYDEAFAKWLALAEKGNAQGILNVGNMYQAGEGVSKDLSKSIEWYRKGAAQGDPHCLFQLAEAYDTGNGVTANAREALRHYRDAAIAGSTSAQALLGRRLLDDGQTKEAREWLRRAADGGDQSALAILAGLSPRTDLSGSTRVPPQDEARLRQLLSDLDAAANARDASWFTRAVSIDAKIHVRLPGQTERRRLEKSEYAALWQATFDKTERYRFSRAHFEVAQGPTAPIVSSRIREHLTSAGKTRVLELQESLRVSIADSALQITGIELDVRVAGVASSD